MAMLQFFALLKQKITSVSNTAFCNPIGISSGCPSPTSSLGLSCFWSFTIVNSQFQNFASLEFELSEPNTLLYNHLYAFHGTGGFFLFIKYGYKNF
jgi:hypothetical protein